MYISIHHEEIQQDITLQIYIVYDLVKAAQIRYTDSKELVRVLSCLFVFFSMSHPLTTLVSCHAGGVKFISDECGEQQRGSTSLAAGLPPG